MSYRFKTTICYPFLNNELESFNYKYKRRRKKGNLVIGDLEFFLSVRINAQKADHITALQYLGCRVY